MIIWHYSKGIHLPAIQASGLRPSTALLLRDEKPVLWFSLNPLWERTVFSAQAPLLDQAFLWAKPFGGLIRIGLDARFGPYDWKGIKAAANIYPRLAQELYRTALEIGARPGEWRASLDPVPPKEFQIIQRYDGAAWVAFEEAL